MLTPDQEDALRELTNIGVGRAAAELNELLELPIELRVPEVRIVPLSEAFALIDSDCASDDSDLSAVRMGFEGDFAGTAALFFPRASAVNLITTLQGEDRESVELDNLPAGTLTEVGNIVLNGVLGTMANMLDAPLRYAVPDYVQGNLRDFLTAESVEKDAPVITATTRFCVREVSVEGAVTLLFKLEAFRGLVGKIDGAIEQSSEVA